MDLGVPRSSRGGGTIGTPYFIGEVPELGAQSVASSQISSHLSCRSSSGGSGGEPASLKLIAGTKATFSLTEIRVHPISYSNAKKTLRRWSRNLSGQGSTDRIGGLPNWPLMLMERQASEYVQLPLAAFLRAVDAGELPAPRLISGKKRWSRLEIDSHLHEGGCLHEAAYDPIAASIERAFAS